MSQTENNPKPRGTALTKTDVFATCSKLAKEFNDDYTKVTLDEVSKIIDRGSKNTILKYWQEWKELRQIRSKQPVLPDSVQDLLLEVWYIAIKYSEESAEANNAILQAEITAAKKTIEEYKIEVDSKATRIADLEQTHARVSEKLEHANQSLTQVTNEKLINERDYQAKLEHVEDKVSDLTTQLSQAETRYRTLFEAKNSDQIAFKATLNDQKQEYENIIVSLRQQLHQSENTLSETKDQLAKEVLSRSEERSGYKIRINTLEQTISTNKDLSDALSVSNSKLEEENKNYAINNTSLKREIEVIRELHEKTLVEMNALRRNLEETTGKLLVTQTALKACQEINHDLKSKIEPKIEK